eukprot:6220665-Pyramimonas_sp.AAC.1
MWRKVNGPVAAIQATSTTAGWKPEQAALWKRPTQQGDEQWQLPFIDEDGKCDIDAIEYSQLLGDLEHDLDAARRAQAATHLHDEDLQRGGDIWHISKEQK